MTGARMVAVQAVSADPGADIMIRCVDNSLPC